MKAESFYLVKEFPSFTLFISCWTKKFKIVQTIRLIK